MQLFIDDDVFPLAEYHNEADETHIISNFIIYKILTYVDPVFLRNTCALVCRRWFAISRSEALWEIYWGNQSDRIRNTVPFVQHTSYLPRPPFFSAFPPTSSQHFQWWAGLRLSSLMWKRPVMDGRIILNTNFPFELLSGGNARLLRCLGMNRNGILGAHDNAEDRACGAIRLWDLSSYATKDKPSIALPHGTVHFKLLDDTVWCYSRNLDQIMQDIGLYSIEKEETETFWSKLTSIGLPRTPMVHQQTSITVKCLDGGPTTLYGGDRNGLVHKWEILDDTALGYYRNYFKRTHTAAIECCYYDEASHCLATSSLDKTTRFWDIRTGDYEEIIHHHAHCESIQLDQFDFIVGTFAGNIQQFDRRKLQKPVFSCKFNQRISSFYADSHKIIASANRNILYLDRDHDNTFREIARLKHRVHAVKVYGEKLVTSDDSGKVRLWETSLGNLLRLDQ